MPEYKLGTPSNPCPLKTMISVAHMYKLHNTIPVLRNRIEELAKPCDTNLDTLATLPADLIEMKIALLALLVSMTGLVASTGDMSRFGKYNSTRLDDDEVGCRFLKEFSVHFKQSSNNLRRQVHHWQRMRGAQWRGRRLQLRSTSRERKSEEIRGGSDQ